MKPSILIGTKNPFKQKKLAWIVEDFFIAEPATDRWEEPEETQTTFIKIAEQKASNYSRQYHGFAISTDGGAVIPALEGIWDPIHTKRFGTSDEDRIKKLLQLMQEKEDRRIEWYEAIAVAKDGVIVFSSQSKAMDGRVATSFNKKFYQPGIWLCSLTEFPNFGNKNFFELSLEEQKQTEDSWEKLKNAFEKRIPEILAS